jgi:release factor glutamine methyltransferase
VRTASDVARQLAAAGCIAPYEEAAELLAVAPDEGTLGDWVARRERGEPLAWITGVTQFCGRPLAVDHGVYVPRPQTEELARRAAALLVPGGRAADLCTGTGAVAAHLAAAVPEAFVLGVDIDRHAIRCARRNGVRCVLGDLDAGLRSAAFDVVTAVAPYVPTGALAVLPSDVLRYEPLRALDGGSDGLDLVRRVVGGAARLLKPGGWLLLEIGAEQDRALGPSLATNGFGSIVPWSDEDGDLRGLACQASPASPAAVPT